MRSPIRVLYVIGSLQVGGTERQLVELLGRLDRNRFQPVLFCLVGGGPLEARVRELNIPLYSFGIGGQGHGLVAKLRAFVGLLRLYFCIWKYRPHIVHCFLYWANVIGGLLAKAAFVPVLITSRRSMGLYKDQRRILQPLENLVNRFTDIVTVNSRRVWEDVLAREKVAHASIRLIYNGVSGAPPSGSSREELCRAIGIPQDDLLVMCVANLHQYKGHQDLVTAFGLVRTQFDQRVNLLCIGRDAGRLDFLRKQCSELGLADSVFFLGQRSDAASLLRHADIAVLASHEEGFSNAILEGMVAGVPQVVTDVGGNSEAIVDGVSGLVVPPHAPERLAEALLRLLVDKNLRFQMGAAAHKVAQTDFTFDSMVDRVQSIYEECLVK